VGGLDVVRSDNQSPKTSDGKNEKKSDVCLRLCFVLFCYFAMFCAETTACFFNVLPFTRYLPAANANSCSCVVNGCSVFDERINWLGTA